MSSEAIKLEHITKVYKLYNRNRDRLKILWDSLRRNATLSTLRSGT